MPSSCRRAKASTAAPSQTRPPSPRAAEPEDIGGYPATKAPYLSMWKLYVASEQPMLADTSSLTCIGNGATSLAENWQMAPRPVTTFQNQALFAPTVCRPISRHVPADRLKTATLTVAAG